MDEQLLYEMIGERIRAARNRTGLSQTRLARALKVSRASIVNIEAGRQRAPVHTLWRIAAELKTEVVTLIPRLSDVEDGNRQVKLDESTVRQIEAAANGNPATKRRLLEFIGSTKRDLKGSDNP